MIPTIEIFLCKTGAFFVIRFHTKAMARDGGEEEERDSENENPQISSRFSFFMIFAHASFLGCQLSVWLLGMDLSPNTHDITSYTGATIEIL